MEGRSQGGGAGNSEERTLVVEFDILPDHIFLRAIGVAAQKGDFPVIDGFVETHIKTRKLKGYPAVSDEAIVGAILGAISGGKDG